MLKTQKFREERKTQKVEVKIMAEEIINIVEETTEPNGTENQPTVDELMAQITQLTADRDKYKSANDKLSKSEAEMKRQLRAKQTEDE